MASDDTPEDTPFTEPATWVERYGDALFQYAVTRLRDKNSAEEVVQETFLAGVRHIDQFRGEGTEEHWLKGIMRRKIIDFVRQQARQDRQLEKLHRNVQMEFLSSIPGDFNETLIPLATDPPIFVNNDKLWAQLKKCLKQVPQKQADVFIMRYLEGLRAHQIIDTLEISDANYWVLLHRARTRLAECLLLAWGEGMPKDPA